MWYLHVHFVCARLLAFWAMAITFPSGLGDLNNHHARGEGASLHSIFVIHPHSGWFIAVRGARRRLKP